jgi:phage protein D
MSGLFNFIKGLFAGIFAFFGGLFGGKKASESTTLEAATKSATRKNSAYFLELDEAKGGGTVEPKTSVQTVEKPQPAAAAPAKAAPAVQTVEPVKQPQPVSASNGAVQAPATFAPDSLLSLSATNGRRRPGANMNYFLNMARQTK